MYPNCCGLLLIVFFIQLFVTAALHALILIVFYLLISGFGISWIGCLSAKKKFSSSKKNSRKLYTRCK